MNGIYCNKSPLSKPFVFYKDAVRGYSIRLSIFKYSRVGKFEPPKYTGNLLIAPECMSRWSDEV